MAKFRFKLEPLLTAREHAERRRQRVVAEIENERIALENKLRGQQRFITEGKHAMRGRLQGTLDLSDLRGHAGATMRGLRDAQRLAIELAGIYERLQAARSELAEAARDRRAVELLKEKRHLEWRQAEERRETAFLDELAVQAAARDGAKRDARQYVSGTEE